MTPQAHVPASAELFATALIADRELRNEVLGDLVEEYQRLSSAANAPNATWWFWSQLMRSAVSLSNMAIARGGRAGWMRHLVAVVTGLLVMLAILRLGGMLTWRMRGVAYIPETIKVSHPGFGQPLFGVVPPVWLVVTISLAVQVTAGATSGYVAAALGRSSPAAPALRVVAVYVGFMYVLPLLVDGVPRWGTPLACLVAGAVAGVALRARVVGRAQLA
jgi:hypothetical protein